MNTRLPTARIRPVFVLWSAVLISQQLLFGLCQYESVLVWQEWWQWHRPLFHFIRRIQWSLPYSLAGVVWALVSFGIAYVVGFALFAVYRHLIRDTEPLVKYLDDMLLWASSSIVAQGMGLLLIPANVGCLLADIHASGMQDVPSDVLGVVAGIPIMLPSILLLGLLLRLKDILVKSKPVCYAINIVMAISARVAISLLMNRLTSG